MLFTLILNINCITLKFLILIIIFLIILALKFHFIRLIIELFSLKFQSNLISYFLALIINFLILIFLMILSIIIIILKVNQKDSFGLIINVLSLYIYLYKSRVLIHFFIVLHSLLLKLIYINYQIRKKIVHLLKNF